MRNLKRALSLALASVMVMGMMVVGTSASYKDVDDADNVEAIEVLQAVGIMVGDDNGNFNPDAKVTRNEMAVIMSNLLNLDYDYYRGINPFTDVPAWAAPYVAACAAEGVTGGIGNGLYGGSNTITASQAALMIMKALGYFQYAEDFGDDWQVATIRQASYINLFENINANAETPLTRNQVAQMVLNGLKAEMVDFTGDVGSKVTINGATINVGYRAEYTSRTNSAKKYNTIIGQKTDIAGNNQYYVQLGEELYNGKLKLAPDTTDVFGRPARTWSYDGEEIGTYVNYDLLVAEYTAKATGKTMYEVIGKTAYDKYDFESYLNGDDKDTIYKAIDKNNKGNVPETGKGALTQVFVDTENENVIVTVINTYLAEATADYNEKKDSATFKIYGLSGTNQTQTVSGEDFAVEDIEDGDFVLVTFADDEIQTIADVEIVSDVEISKFSADGTTVTAVTADGTKYDASKTLTYDTGVLASYTNTNLKETTYNVYLDKYGYAIGVDIVDEKDNYVFITGVDESGSFLSTKNFDANALFLDGTSAVIEVKNNGAIAEGGAVINKWFTYTVSKSGVYTLTAVPGKLDTTDPDLAQAKHNLEVTSGVRTENVINSKHISLKTNDGKVYGNDDSIYLLAELDKVTKGGTDYAVIKDVDEVVVGVDNASFELYTWGDARAEVSATVIASGGSVSDANTSSGVYVLYNDDNYVIAAVVVGESDSVSENIAYVISDDLEDESWDKNAEEWTWTREVIINGESVMLTEVGDSNTSVLEGMSEGTWYTIKYDANGNVKKVVPYNETTEAASYADDIEEAVQAIEADENPVVVAIADVTNDYTLKGKTLYDGTTNKEGFRIDDDVNIVLDQTIKNKGTTEYYKGVDALKSILEELNSDTNGHKYDFNAVIGDKGRATSVIIIDKIKDKDYTGPSGSSSSYTAEMDYVNNRVIIKGSAPNVSDSSFSETELVNAMKAKLEEEGYVFVKWTGNPTWQMQVTDANGGSATFTAYYTQK